MAGDGATSMVAGAESALGSSAQAEVQIVPLEEVEIETEQRLVAEPSVRIDGQRRCEAEKSVNPDS